MGEPNDTPLSDIYIFASFPSMLEWTQDFERCKSRKAAANCIRDARAKGGFNIKVFNAYKNK